LRLGVRAGIVAEADVKFGINTVGELGNLALGKIELGMNYEVRLK